MLRAAGAALRKELEPALAAPTGLTSVVESSPVESSESVVVVVVVEPPVSELVEEELGEEADPVEVEVEPPVKQEESEEALTVICRRETQTQAQLKFIICGVAAVDSREPSSKNCTYVSGPGLVVLRVGDGDLNNLAGGDGDLPVNEGLVEIANLGTVCKSGKR